MISKARAAGAIALATAFTALLTLASADAALAAYTQTGSFSGPGTGDGELDLPQRADVNQITGDLFVADSGNDRIQVFESSGDSAAYLAQFTDASIDAPLSVAIDQSDGSIYVSDADDIVKFDSTFALDGTFTSPGITGPLAVDPTDGDLLVADQATDTVRRFDSDGSPDGASPIDGTNGSTAFTGVLDLDVNSTGDVYVVDANGPIKSGPGGTPSPTGTSVVKRFSSTGAFQAELTPVGPNQRPATVAVNPADDSVAVSGEQDAIYRDQQPTIHTFDSANAALQSFPVSSPPPFITVAGLAFDGPRLYIVHDVGYYSDGNTYGSQPGIKAYELLPAVSTGAASAVTDTIATLHGTVDPEGITVTDCHFEYTDDADFQANSFANAADATCVPSPGGGSGDVAVSADLTGLTGETTYHFRLTASYGGGTANGLGETFTTPPSPAAPEAVALPPGPVSATTAVIGGTVDPNNAPTTYYVEYADNPTFTGSASLPVTQDADAGSGGDPVFDSRFLTSLTPDTDYFYRLVAHNSLGDGTSATRTLHTLPLPSPSPPCSNEELRIGPSANLPDCRAYEQVSPVDKNGTDVINAGGSQVSALGDGIAYVTANAFGDARAAGLASLYRSLRGEDGWSTDNISPPLPPGSAATNPAGLSASKLVALSSDLSGAVFHTQANPPILPGTQPDIWNLYRQLDMPDGPYELINPEWPDPGAGPFTANVIGASTDLSHVLIDSAQPLTSDTPPLSGAQSGLYDWTAGELRLVTVLPDETVAPDASSQLLGNPGRMSTDGSRVFFATDGSLYVRFNNSSTTLVGPMADQFAYQGATPTGSDVFYTDAGDLYVYDVDSSQTTEIGTASAAVGFGDDGESAYFLNQAGDLFAWYDGTVTTIASSVGAGEAFDASPNGRYLVFTTDERLTSYDNGGVNEVYRYDAQTSTLECVSCGADNDPPAGNARLSSFVASVGQYGIPRHMRRPQNVFDTGRVVFESPEPLVLADTNGQQDVYMWHEGQAHLISSGQAATPSSYSDASENGDDIFFLTRQQLVGQDIDHNLDLYDARVGGGFAEPASGPAPCHGDSCQDPPSGAPDAPPAGSSSFTGPGNQGTNRTPAAETHSGGKKCKKLKKKKKARRKCAKNPKRGSK